jgi:hypothetical protein
VIRRPIEKLVEQYSFIRLGTGTTSLLLFDSSLLLLRECEIHA